MYLERIYPYFIRFHIFFSVVFLIIALGITFYTLHGWLNKRAYTSFSNKFRQTFLVFLFIDLLLGIILYFFLQKPPESIDAARAMRLSNMRFWAVQHFSNMVFVVILCLIGSMFISRTSDQIKKYKYSFIYFGISTLIILISVGLMSLRK